MYRLDHLEYLVGFLCPQGRICREPCVQHTYGKTTPAVLVLFYVVGLGQASTQYSMTFLRMLVSNSSWIPLLVRQLCTKLITRIMLANIAYWAKNWSREHEPLRVKADVLLYSS